VPITASDAAARRLHHQSKTQRCNCDHAVKRTTLRSKDPAAQPGFTITAVLTLALGIGANTGLTAYSVSRRTPEIGLRVALGANQPQILRLVVGRGLVTSIIGAAIGVGAALMLTRGLSGMLYGVTATDPLVFAGVPLLLIAVSVLASYVPARKATRIDPLAALRYDKRSDMSSN
jgi:ABC-type antimicrobial peptide transport system permease subunit